MRWPSISTDVRRGIKRPNPPRDVLERIERGGSRAFDEIALVLQDRPLRNSWIVNGLRRMALTARLHCPERKPDLIRLAAGFCTHESRIVRTEAVNVALLELFLLDNLSQGKGFPVTRDDVARIRRGLRESIASALALGVDLPREREARRFLDRYQE